MIGFTFFCFFFVAGAVAVDGSENAGKVKIEHKNERNTLSYVMCRGNI